MRRHFILFWLLFLISLPLFFSGSLREYPSDRTMARRFERNEATFSELRRQLLANPDVRYLSRNAGFYSSDSLSLDELGVESSLPTLMRRLNLVTVAERDGGANIYMELARVNHLLASSDGYKGYAYLSTPPHPNFMAENLDTLNYTSSGLWLNYKHLKGNWYLYLEYRDS